MKTGYLYSHTRLDTNEIFYIGVGFDKTYKRAFSKNGRNKYWKNIVNLAGYFVQIVLENLPKEELFLMEKSFIKMYGRHDLKLGNLCNMTDGGEGGANPCPEKRKILSEKMKNRIISEDTKKLIRDANIGRKHSQETILKFQKIHNGKTISEETKRKISEANKGRVKKPLSEETKDKLRKINVGKSHSNKTKLKIKNSSMKRAKSVSQFKDGVLIRNFDSISETANFGFNLKCVSMCCNGNRLMHKGFEWKFVET